MIARGRETGEEIGEEAMTDNKGGDVRGGRREDSGEGKGEEAKWDSERKRKQGGDLRGGVTAATNE